MFSEIKVNDQIESIVIHDTDSETDNDDDIPLKRIRYC